MGAKDSRDRLQMCGRFVFRFRGERIEERLPGRQGRLLLAFLATRDHRSATRDEMIDALWPREMPSAPDMALSALLSKLRRLLGEAALAGRSSVHLKLPAHLWVDVAAASEALHLAEALAEQGRWEEAFAPVGIARFIHERPFMTGEQAPWIEEVERAREELLRRSMECAALVSYEIGGAEAAVTLSTARRLIELSPYRESGYCLLMRALEREGNRAEALAVFEQLRTRLRDDLGTSPSMQAQEIHTRLLG